MAILEIIGTPLYQWEKGRKVRVNQKRGVTIDSVDFSHEGDKDALVVKPREEGGIIVADIPNILLQDDRNIVAYTVMASADGVETLQDDVFRVRQRAKPSDYVYTEVEILNYETLEKRINKLEEEGVSVEQLAKAVEDYLSKNPVGVPSGGKAGQYLRKKSDADRDVEWADLEIPKEYGLISYDQDRTITIT